jgi:hypothetical protein
VSFHTDEVGGFDTVDPIASHPAFGKIIAVTTEKTLGTASGTFTITVKKPPSTEQRLRSWRNLWRDPEQVWVRIKFIVDGQTIDTMFGQIDSVSESTTRSGGGMRDETFQISGRDFGKVFETTELFTNFHADDGANPIRQQAALTRTGIENKVGTPAHFVRFLIEAWLANNGIGEAQWMLPASLGGVDIASQLNLTTIQAMDKFRHGWSYQPSIISIEGTSGNKLWDSMSELSHGLLNELFFDLAPPPDGYGGLLTADSRSPGQSRAGAVPLDGLAPSVYLRERRFPTFNDDRRQTNHALWDATRTRKLARGDVQMRSLARGGASHRYNYWELDPIGLATQDYGARRLLQRGIEGVAKGRPGSIPIYSEESIARHGVRRYYQTTRFLPMREANSTETNQWIRTCARWLKMLHDWYVIAPFELSGSITTTRVMPEIRIGERIREERNEGDVIYYCEGVRNEWHYPGAGKSVLTVTRGEYEDDDLLAFVYDKYDNPSALSVREQCFIRDDATVDEVIDALARGCTFAVPREAHVLGHTIEEEQLLTVEGETFTADPQEQRTLVEERDPTSIDLTEGNADPGMNTISTADPAVGLDGDLPVPDAQPIEEPGAPGLSQEQLERGDAIDSALDFELEDDDPIGGLDLTGSDV